MMDSDEREIYYYLKGWKDSFLSAHEICRRAGGKRRYRQEPLWANAVLMRMVEKGILETDAAGYYRLKPVPQKCEIGKRWVSPHVAKILRDSGKGLDLVIAEDMSMDEYYENL